MQLKDIISQKNVCIYIDNYGQQQNLLNQLKDLGFTIGNTPKLRSLVVSQYDCMLWFSEGQLVATADTKTYFRKLSSFSEPPLVYAYNDFNTLALVLKPEIIV